MVFSSPEFVFVLLPCVAALLALARRSGSLRVVVGVLLAVSLGLYAYSEPRFLVPLVLLIVANYTIARRLNDTTARHGVAWLTVGILLNLAPIMGLKYTCLIQADGGCSSWLPLGISFFSFQQITFLTDARKHETVIPSFLHYALFIVFFPQLVAGPILRGDEFLGQLRSSRLLANNHREHAAGLTLFGIGLLKKLVVADGLARYVDHGLSGVAAGYQPTFLEAWGLVSSGAAQIYFDYSAYADFAMALGLLCGIHIPPSFLSPYKALSIAEFWRRWNVTLMRFFRDHIYIPLGGSRHGPARRAAAITCAMIACGLWHGAGVNFALWGGVVAGLLVGESIAASPLSRASVLVRRAIVHLSYVLPLAVFLTPELADTKRLIAGMFGFGGFAFPSSVGFVVDRIAEAAGWAANTGHTDLPLLSAKQVGLCSLAWAIVYALPNTYEIFSDVFTVDRGRQQPHEIAGAFRLSWRPNWGWAVVTVLLLVLGLTAYEASGTRAFFYYRF